jgi:cell division protein ZapE
MLLLLSPAKSLDFDTPAEGVPVTQPVFEGPRSPADYVAIASEYQSVIIAGVPVFDDAADNAARRFISVIDEFYDRGVNVILSAAASPAELYRGEKLKFEFQRTASRLVEMQSKEYLASAHRAA